ncbi:MAG: hypothetical protein HY331_12585 [Chloroflexi bacterium]|nr:hypothetical protein [Chloroflexota bacterium]
MLPIGPERWPELRRIAVDPLLAAVLWAAAASFAEAAARDERGQVERSARRQLRTGQAVLALLGASAWLRAGYRGARRYGLTMEEASVAGGLAGALGATLALAVRVVWGLAGPPRPGRRERAAALALAAPPMALAGYVGGATLAAFGAFLEGRSVVEERRESYGEH